MRSAFGAPRGGRAIGRAVARVAVLVVSIGLVGGCGSGGRAATSAVSAAASPPDVVVAASPAGTAVEIARAQTLQVLPPSAAPTAGVTIRYEVRPTDSPVLALAGPDGLFVAGRPGTVTVLVAQAPTCPPGKECPAHLIALGSVRVTVTG